MSEPVPGLSAEFKHTVTDADTASHWGSGGLPVLATPVLVGLMEISAVMALAGQLSPGQTTVGGYLDVRHLAATPVGMQVRAKAELIAVEGHKLVFKIQVWDEVELIGTADHFRYVINETSFMAKVAAKINGKSKLN
jgi:fluoroacetyl-CoA thioesterase